MAVEKQTTEEARKKVSVHGTGFEQGGSSFCAGGLLLSIDFYLS
jgi:hypothetical protein